MIFPFESLSDERRALGLAVAVVIGIAFGFVLERTGFGRAQKLVGQFYGNDMTVFKGLFGGVVTAMLGAVILSGVHLLDVRAVSAGYPTFLWPMIVGGLLLGVGFIVSGYCPGTSLVAAASAKLDGVVTVLGVVLGGLLYAELAPHLGGFHDSGKMGAYFLYDLFGTRAAVVAAVVTIVAVAAFLGAEKVEALVNGKAGARVPARRWVLTGFVAFALVAVATLAIPALAHP